MLNRISDDDLYAILGPTNTGKTHYALERMLSHKSGIFGFPLRLLARENYDKAIHKVGIEKVALITGEEKIVHKSSKYFFCTVESMPRSMDVDFVAIDEIQLASDFERGYIFTDRILHSRGIYETVLLGSLNIQSLLKKIFPNIKIQTKDRFSKLTYTKRKNINKLQPRTAVVGFNINELYEMAEILRSQKGGAAVVHGALSPRTRNSQVEMYESENVNFLVATDAIGMGLNLNIEHVAFSSTRKFDGQIIRKLKLTELGQIAGRAGRYKNDGTFGLTNKASELDAVSIDRIENHLYDPINEIYWRNSKIDFSSVISVLNSLNQNPISNLFVKKRNAQDEKSFKSLSKDLEIKKYLHLKENVEILWNVCRIPDFQKLMTGSYLEFLKVFFINLMINDCCIPDNWINDHVKRLDSINGNIDMLSKRIAYIRTWTYISNHAKWIKNRNYWQEITRNIEDRLSDELHKKLKLRFVDQKAANFVDKIKKGNNLKVEFKKNVVEVEGFSIGYLKGFTLILNKDNENNYSPLAIQEAKKSILKMIPDRINSLIIAPDDAFSFGNISSINMNQEINIYWGDEVIASLTKDKKITSPKISLLNFDLLETTEKEKIIKRLDLWMNNKVQEFLEPIQNETNNTSQSSTIRSIIYNLHNDLGCIKKENIEIDLKNLSPEEKRELSKLGIRNGIDYLYFPSFMKKQAIELRAILWKVYNSYSQNYYFPLPTDGRVYFNVKDDLPLGYWRAIGYVLINKLAIRVDIYERVSYLTRKMSRYGPVIQSSSLMNLIGCTPNQLKEVLLFFNFDSIVMGNNQLLFFRKKEIKKSAVYKRKIVKKVKKKQVKINLDSPFAVLKTHFNR